MADRRVKVIFSAEIQNYKSAMAEAAQSTEKTKKASEDAGKASETASKSSSEAAKQAAVDLSKQNAAMEEVGQTATIAGAAVLAGVGLAVKSYADFDKQMSSVDAATHETAGNMDLLRQAAVDAGADTAFSAVEAAKGIEELAKAGVSTKDILAGGLDGALALAAAGSLDVGKAAEIAASALVQFKLSGDKVPHVADLLAAGAGKAQGSVEDLGAALNQSGLVAASTGLTIEETTGALSAFASAGLTGSDAGTSFKTMLMSLNPNSAAAASLMNELGISAYDAQGNFVGMSEYAGILQGALKDMSDEQRNATLKTLFGSDAVRAANVLYEQGSEGIGKWEDAVNDAGYAAETAARMQDNLAGDLEKLGGAFDTVLIQSGSGANEVLRGMVQGLEDVVDAVGQVPAPVLAAATGFAAVLGGATLLAGGLITVIPKIRATKDALEVLAPAGSKANAALSRTGKIAAGAATGLAAVAAAASIAGPAMDKILQPTGPTGDALEKFAGQAAKGAVGADTLSLAFQDLVNHQDGVSDFQTAINGIADPGIWGNIDNIATDTIGVLTIGMVDLNSTSEEARDRMRAFGTELSSLDAGKAADAFQSMAKQTDGSQESLTRLLEFMPEYRDKLKEQAKAAGLATDDQTLLNIALDKIPTSTKPIDDHTEALKNASVAAATGTAPAEDIAKALDEIGLAADGTVTNLGDFTEALLNAGLLQLSTRDATRNYEAALDALTESITANGDTLDITTEKGRNNQAALDGIASAGINMTKAMAVSGEGQDAIQGKLHGTYEDLKTAAGQFGITGGEAEALARKVLGVPDGVTIDSFFEDAAAKAKIDALDGKLDGIDGRVVTTSVLITYSDIGRDEAMARRESALSGRATGGRLPGYSDGGQLPANGPGTGVTDGFLGIDSAGMPVARLDAREWIINGNSSDRYNRELAAINAGTFPKLPGYANGMRAGREYSAQSLGYAPYQSSAPARGGMHIDKVEINEQTDPRATFAEFARRTQALDA